ncbi:lysogenization protein HflD [Acinetobacter puyangensis]|uniref:lysogenization protein HflD n=1 Tax=Acinetobacter puyangensis TaxID=1096779 RepID=UPI003A4E27F5
MTIPAPFIDQDQFNTEQHQVIALAAVFQAAQLVHAIATAGSQRVGELGQHYATVLLQASLNIRVGHNPNSNSLVFFKSLSDVHLGLHTLEQSLVMPYDPQPKQRYPRVKTKNPKQALRYAMSLLQLSAKVYAHKDYPAKIEQTQQKIIRQFAFFDHDYQNSSIIAALAQTYSDTASHLKPRIMVKGSSQAFRNNHEVALIRALLFAGLQAAHYWRDLGGSPWKMIFSKGKILKHIRYFAELQHQQQQLEVESKSL